MPENLIRTLTWLVVVAACGAVSAASGQTPRTERFVVIGDSGWAGVGQTRVANAIELACEARGGCTFGLMTGDNIYPAGVSSAQDPLWASNFEAALGDLFPFYAVLGNHDYGGITERDEVDCDAPVSCLKDLKDEIQNRIARTTGGLGLDPSRAEHQLAYASSSLSFRMPSTHYRFHSELIDFVALDTTPIYWADANEDTGLHGQFRLGELKRFLEKVDRDNAPRMFEYADGQHAAQRTDVPIWVGESTRRWRIAFGHHPYLSNGSHGNAGDYNGTGGLEGSGLPKGTVLKKFIEDQVLQAGFHAYLSGHDHNLQDLGEHKAPGSARGTQMIVSGSGSKISDLRPGPIDPNDDDAPHNRTLYQAKCYGFVMVEASESELRFLFIVVPSGERSDCADQTEDWVIEHERAVVHYESD